jgi:uncharacterized membrane protein YfhO
LLAYGPNRAVFYVETSAPALLVLSDLLYPGWRATADGEAVPLYATNGLFRGVVVPAGAHRVEMRYFPQSLRWGLGLMGMALAVIMWIFATNLHEWHYSQTRNDYATDDYRTISRCE